MREIGWLLTILLILGWVASELPLGHADSAEAQSQTITWRRTVNGWEKINEWTPRPLQPKPDLHPGYLALVQIVFCFGAIFWVKQGEPSSATSRGSGSMQVGSPAIFSRQSSTIEST